MNLPQISIVVPLYNESLMFPLLIKRLDAVCDAFPHSVEIVLIDDGSKDDTAALMYALAYANPRYNCVFLSRNHGHQLALTAGLSRARGTEAIMVIDGDLQDPPELLTDFYAKLQEGYDVVYAVRKKRKENFVKKTLYFSFYRLLKQISYIDIPPDSGDFCLMSRRVADILGKMPEESRFIRGMRSWIGFKQIGLEYERDARAAGEAKYDFSMLFKLAFNGIFNFSEFPIKFITSLGGYSMLLAIGYLTWVLFKKFVLGIEIIEGFTALLFTIILFSSVQLLSIGILGEYILRIFFQVKDRPLFIIKEQVVDTVSKV
jgi:dolichol-phosphate mannosyltransferase